MLMHTSARKEYCLLEKNVVIGKLVYKNFSFIKGEIILFNSDEIMTISSILGLLNTNSFTEYDNQIAEIKDYTRNTILLYVFGNKKKYYIKKTGIWRIKFISTNDKNEELVTLVPKIRWAKKTQEYALQINEALTAEITPALILHTLHCANCSLCIIDGSVHLVN